MSVPAIARSKQLAGTDLARISSMIVAGPTGPTGPAGPTAVSSLTSADGSLAVAGSASVSLNLNQSHSNAWGALQSFTGMNLAQRTGGPAADSLSFFACETFAFAWQGPWANQS